MDLTREESSEVLTKVRQIHGALYGEGNTLGICTKMENQADRITSLEKAESKRTGIMLAISVGITGLVNLLGALHK